MEYKALYSATFFGGSIDDLQNQVNQYLAEGWKDEDHVTYYQAMVKDK